MTHPRRLARRSLVFVIAWSLLASATTLGAEPPLLDESRTDQRATGDRVAEGRGLAGTWTDIQLGATPLWVLSDPAASDFDWLVVLEDGSVVRVRVPAEAEPAFDGEPIGTLEPREPAIATVSADGALVVASAVDAEAVFADAIPDARIVRTPDGTLVALTGATERYPHGVLGDGFEASSISLRYPDGTTDRIEIELDGVVEGLTPMLLDLDDDGELEIVVTVSDTFVGARLVAYGLDGAWVGASDPIGRGFRWTHQLGGGPIGPDGETEIVTVRTPHIGGILESYRFIDGRLELVASEPGYSSHRLGSPNLDMASLADVDGDGRLDVVVPTQDMRTLGVLTRRGDGFALIESLPLDGTLVTNLAATADDEGRLVLAAGTDDGRLRIFR